MPVKHVDGSHHKNFTIALLPYKGFDSSLVNFIKVEAESLSVAEQVQLFSSAEVIIGAHGAGLVNLTFCRPGTIVIEIFSPTYITPLYWAICSFGNLNHHYFIGHYAGGNRVQENRGWTGLDNITITPRKFAALIRNMKL